MNLRKKISFALIPLLAILVGVVFHSQIVRGAKILASVVVPQPDMDLVVSTWRPGPNPNELIAAPGMTVHITGPENPPTQTKVTVGNPSVAVFRVFPGQHTISIDSTGGCSFPTQSFTVYENDQHYASFVAILSCTANPPTCNKTRVDLNLKVFTPVTENNISLPKLLPNILVRLYDNASNYLGELTTNQNTSDYNGTFQDLLKNSTYRLNVNPKDNNNPHYNSAYQSRDAEFLVSDYDCDGVDLFSVQLDKPTQPAIFSLLGVVVDATNASPLAGAEITMTRTSVPSTPITTSTYNSPDSSGANYHFNNLATANYSITVTKSGYTTIITSLSALEITTSTIWKNFAMQPVVLNSTISGRVSDEKGNALSGATVNLYDAPIKTPFPPSLKSTQTDSAGNYTLTLGQDIFIPGHQYYLVAFYEVSGKSSRGYYINNFQPDLIGQKIFKAQAGAMNNMDITIPLSQSQGTGIYGHITGKKQGENGVIERINLHPVKITATSAGEERSVIDGDDGNYLLQGLNGNRDYDVRADFETQDPSQYYTSVTKTVYVAKNTLIKLDFEMSENPDFQYPGRVMGKVVDNESGQPIPGARIVLVRKSDNEPIRSATTDSDGKYKLSLSFPDCAENSCNWNPFNLENYDVYVRAEAYDPKNIQNPILSGDEYNFNAVKTVKIHPTLADVVEVDFRLGGTKTPPNLKKVKVVVEQVFVDIDGKQLKKWTDAEGKKHTSPEPAAEAKVILALGEPVSNTTISGSIVLLEQTTNSYGVAKFDNVPNNLIRAIVEKNGFVQSSGEWTFLPTRPPIDGDGYRIFKVTIKGRTSLDRLLTDQRFLDKIYEWQGDERWGSKHPKGFEPDHTIASHGCCLTSISMALRYYLSDHKAIGGGENFVGREITPDLINEYVYQYLETAKLRDSIEGIVIGLSGGRLQVALLDPPSSDNIDLAIQQGYPVVAYFDEKYGVPHHRGTHCVLIIATRGGKYTYLDPNPRDEDGNEIGTGNADDGKISGDFNMNKLSAAYVILPSNNGQLAQFNWQRPPRATAQNGTAYKIRDLEIIPQSNVPLPLAKISASFGHGDVRDFDLSKTGMIWNGQIPAFLMTTGLNFSYRISVTSALGAIIETAPIRVSVDNSSLSAAQRVRILSSKISYRLNQSSVFTALRNFLKKI